MDCSNLPPHSDAERWMTAAAQGDQEAFALVAAAVAPRLHRFLRGQGLAAGACDELTQDTLVRAWLARERYRPGAALLPWLYTIARNLLANQRRDGATRQRHLQRYAAENSSPEHGHEVGDLWQQARALLPESWYEMLWLRYGEDCSAPEIAEILQLQPGHVRVTLHRARQRLAQAAGFAS